MMSSLAPAASDESDVDACRARDNGEFRHGVQSGPPDVRLLVGHCVFGSPDAGLLVSLLPKVVHVRGERRLTTLVQLVGDESGALAAWAREVVLGAPPGSSAD